MTTRSASVYASTGSCVTSSRTPSKVARCRRRSRRISERVPASSAAKGSSSRRSLGSVASARASATLCAWPPDSALRAVRGVISKADAIEPAIRSSTSLGLRDAARSEAERDVLPSAEAREEEVVLEHDCNRSALGRHVDAAGSVVEPLAVELDHPIVDRQQACEAPERGRLARPIGSEDRDGLCSARGHGEVELERSHPAAKSRVETHGFGAWPLPKKRSRNATSTPNETAMSTKLSTIASSGFVSLAM